MGRLPTITVSTASRRSLPTSRTEATFTATPPSARGRRGTRRRSRRGRAPAGPRPCGPPGRPLRGTGNPPARHRRTSVGAPPGALHIPDRLRREAEGQPCPLEERGPRPRGDEDLAVGQAARGAPDRGRERIQLAIAGRPRGPRADEGRRFGRPTLNLAPRDRREDRERDDAEEPPDRPAELRVVEEHPEQHREREEQADRRERDPTPRLDPGWMARGGRNPPLEHPTPPARPGSPRGSRSPGDGPPPPADARCTGPPRRGRSRSTTPRGRRGAARPRGPRAPSG